MQFVQGSINSVPDIYLHLIIMRYITIFFSSNECGGWDIDTLSSIQLHHGSYLPVIGRVLRFAYELQL
jgi:hypothetical protein